MSDDYETEEEVEESEEAEESGKDVKASRDAKPAKGAKASTAAAKSDAKKKRQRKRNPAAKWFREMKSEMKKVSWPTRKQTINNTLVALVVMVASGIVIWGVDQVAATIFEGIRTALSVGG